MLLLIARGKQSILLHSKIQIHRMLLLINASGSVILPTNGIQIHRMLLLISENYIQIRDKSRNSNTSYVAINL